jgi:hypothetical protein
MPIRFSPILRGNREVYRIRSISDVIRLTPTTRVFRLIVWAAGTPKEDELMATSFGVYRTSQAQASRDGSSAKAVGVPEAVFPDFDSAYQAAYDAGGDRWVISSRGSSEYVPKAGS